ncbi:MAG TPA: TIGR00730 family Rossman fold protein [Pseudobacteroides sp.]|uniref:LOG family protein n=1 Tax=Pseudobacteroides sp. TaxID=1968840 RepID=UPI002F937440
MGKVICVYSSSSDSIDRAYFDCAKMLGYALAKRGCTMIFGGGMTGLMGECARTVHQYNGKVVGIIPKSLNVTGIVYEKCDELIVTQGMRERKGLMDEKSDAFIALPGGFGTLEEILEIITLKQLQYHNKPIVILNACGFYDNLKSQFQTIIDRKFAKEECNDLFYVTDSVDDALEYIANYVPHVFGCRWLT